jgi:hypothetical protein
MGEVCLIRSDTCDPLAEGECVEAPTGCSDESDPVCGCDGETYDNACLALLEGVAIESDGVCEVAPIQCGGVEGTICESGRACLIEEGVCDPQAIGVCVEGPGDCSLEPDAMVCGCDGTTYRNSCEAMQAGVVVESQGECVVVEPDPV